MRNEKEPVYMIGVAARLCNVHPQTLRTYERMGLVSPSRVGAKNRLFSESDIFRVRRIQRLTQDLGVNLAGVEIILKLLDDMDDLRNDLELQVEQYRLKVEEVVQELTKNTSLPVRTDQSLVPKPQIQWRRTDFDVSKQ